jgi:hypothetical protein
MTFVQAFQAYEPFTPIITVLGVADTICLPAMRNGWYYFVDGVIISNLANAARTFDLHLRPTATVAGATNQICNDLGIEANTLYQMPIGPLTVPPGWAISGLASVAASVNVILTGHLCIMPPLDVRTA